MQLIAFKSFTFVSWILEGKEWKSGITGFLNYEMKYKILEVLKISSLLKYMLLSQIQGKYLLSFKIFPTFTDHLKLVAVKRKPCISMNLQVGNGGLRCLLYSLYNRKKIPWKYNIIRLFKRKKNNQPKELSNSCISVPFTNHLKCAYELLTKLHLYIFWVCSFSWTLVGKYAKAKDFKEDYN